MAVLHKPRRVAVITGAAGGIGKALVKAFSREGYQVIGIDLKKSRMRQAEWITFDLARLHRRTAETQEFFKDLRSLCGGRLDALVNNAAIQIVKPVVEVGPQDWHQTLTTNLLAPFWLIQSLLPLLRRAHGSVVNIASIHAQLTKPHFALYATSKAALVGLTRSLALELAPKVRVNAVLPGATDTEMLRAGFADRPGDLDDLRSFHPLRIIATPKNIAETVLFLASPASHFTTGASLCVDGGVGVCLPDPGNLKASRLNQRCKQMADSEKND
jgi:NAD(P)-dependent dehydrogenase (short-subunit alcohol dehydrogenase family)